MRIAVAVLAAFSTLGSGAQGQTLQDAFARLRATWNMPTEPFRIIGNVYYVGTAGLSSFLVVTPQGHILIDTGLPEANPLIKANVEALGFRVADIRQILNTHAHFDHAGGLAEMKRDTGAPLAASAADKPLLEGGVYPGREGDGAMGFPPVTVDRVIGEGDLVTLGGVTLTAMMTPGHSPGCTSWTATVSENGRDHRLILFCSGTVAANRLVGRPTHPTIVADYRKTFARAKTVEADVFLGPHPEMFDMAAKRAAMRDGAPNPFVRPGEFRAYAAKLEAAFEGELARQAAAAGAKN